MNGKYVLSSMLALGAASLAVAGPITFASKSVPIRAGVVLLDSQRTSGGWLTGIPTNPAPHVWGQLDRMSGVKPPSWTFVNHRAQTVLTQTLRDRWLTLNTFYNDGSVDLAPGNIGERLTKRDAPYWEVNLRDLTSDAVASYDVLLLPLEGEVQLGTLEREKLRRFVDGGGVLWIDVAGTGAAFDLSNPLPAPFFVNAGGGTVFIDRGHPVLNNPNRLTPNEVFGLFNAGGWAEPFPNVVPNQAWASTDFDLMLPVVGNNVDRWRLGIGRIGDGLIMVTLNGASLALGQSAANGNLVNNQTYRSGGITLSAAQVAAAKLIVNAITFGGQSSGDTRGSRHLNSIAPEIDAPLLRRFDVPANVDAPPAHYNGRVFMLEGGRLVCVDAKDNNDLDGDGNPDDGDPDPIGSSADVLWETPRNPAPQSAPVCTEVRVGNTTRRIVLVATYGRGGNSTVVEYDQEDGSVLNVYQAPATDGATLGPVGVPPSPTIHEGLAFVTDTLSTNEYGRVWVIDLRAGSVLNTANGPFAVRRSARFLSVGGAATVGYVPILDSSGGMDRVVYVPTAPGTNRTAGFVSLWLGARGESPSAIVHDAINSRLLITTRAALQNLPIYLPPGANPLGIKVSLRSLDPITGDDLGPISDVQNYISGAPTVGGQNGILNFPLTGAGNTAIWSGPGQNVAFRIDYTIDWSATPTSIVRANPESFVRGDIQFPDEISNSNRILGNLALAQNGNLFVVVAPPDTASNDGYGGSLYCIREYGRGDFRVLYRWDAHDRFTYSSQSGTATPFQYEPAIIDYDGLTNFPGLGFILDRPFAKTRFVGGPTVRGDNVFAMVHAQKAIPFIPPGDRTRFVGALLAFKSDPDPLEVNIEGLNTSNFAIIQPDLARTAGGNKANPNVLSVIQANQPNAYRYEYDGSFARLRFTSLASATRGRLRDVIAVNVPFAVRRAGQPDRIIEPEHSGDVTANGIQGGNGDGRWNPLKWQVVFNGLNPTSQPFLAGDNLFFGGGSYLPALFRAVDGIPGPFTPVGLIYTFNTRLAANDIRTPNANRTWMNNTLPVRTWQKYHSTLDFGTFVPGDPGSTPIVPSKYVLMPNGFDIRSFDDFRTRIRQAALNNNTVNGIAAGEGSVSVWDGSRYYLFGRADFTIVDEGRILRVDSNGNPIWSSDVTDTAGPDAPVVSAGRTLPIGRASRAYSTGSNGFLVADPTSNRVAEVDAIGREVRTITEFLVDPTFVPQGAPDNMVRKLSQPSDVLTFTSIVPAAQNPLTNPQPNEFWIHYVIADTGNQRVIELVDRYIFDAARGVISSVVQYVDPTSNKPGGVERALGVLRWQVKSELTSRRYSYTSIDRAFFDDAAGPRAIYAFAFGNTQPSARALGLDGPSVPAQPVPDNAGGAGGVVLYDPARGAYKVIDRYYVPSVGANVFWNNATQSFNSAAVGARTNVPILGLRSATIRFVEDSSGNPILTVMIADNTGVYELFESAPGVWTVRWWLPREAFVALRRASFSGVPTLLTKNPADFQPTFARRLASGEVLIVNEYVGRHRAEPWVAPAFGISRGDAYNGEVIVLGGYFDPNPNNSGFDWNKPNLGFNNYYVNYELPPISGVRGLLAPRFADKR